MAQIKIIHQMETLTATARMKMMKIIKQLILRSSKGYQILMEMLHLIKVRTVIVKEKKRKKMRLKKLKLKIE